MDATSAGISPKRSFSGGTANGNNWAESSHCVRAENHEHLGMTLAPHVATHGIPGAVAIVGDRDGIRSLEPIGNVAPGGPPMTADSVFQLASMTKAVTSVAALQLVEQGRLQLDAPVGTLLPDLADPLVFEGLGTDGAPAFRKAKRPITLRHLLTHTSGLGYAFVQPEFVQMRGGVAPAPGSMDSIRPPLLFDPGDGWAYGVSTDWVGLAVEAASGQRLDAYFADHILGPLGMSDTAFDLTESMKARLVPMQARGADGVLAPFPISIGGGTRGEFISGGGGLNGTGPDYMRFLRMLLNGGSLDGVTILRPETVAEMARNQIGALRAGAMATTMPALSAAVDWFPDQTPGWGLGFLINPEPGPDGRAAGSLAWAGIANTFYWIDPTNGLAAVLLMQFLPFADPGALAVLGAFERVVYAG